MTQYSPGGLNLLQPLRLAFDDSGDTDVLFAVNAAGELTITPAGGKTTIAGVLRRTSAGAYYWSAQARAAVAVAGTYVKVSTAASTTSIRAQEFTIGANNRATYNGAETKWFKVTYTIGSTGAENNVLSCWRIAKNGTTSPGSQIPRQIGVDEDVGAITVQDLIELATGDYVELWATNETSVDDLFVERGNCIITEE